MKVKYILLFAICLIFSCKGGDDTSDVYPNVVTEFAVIRTNDAGTMVEFTTDDGRTYAISNPQEGFKKNFRYRAVCGYVPDAQKAFLHHATEAYLLHDSTELAISPDPIKVTSVWQSGRYINMHLSPLTQDDRLCEPPCGQPHDNPRWRLTRPPHQDLQRRTGLGFPEALKSPFAKWLCVREARNVKISTWTSGDKYVDFRR